jgi:glycolate oxidase iron-sulfur subunit
MSKKLLDRKLGHIQKTGASVVASANPGCSLQLQTGLREAQRSVRVAHPISLLAEAFRQAKQAD